MAKKYFIVTTAGRTASYWLAAVLNKHSQIICSHSFFVPPVTVYEDPPSDNRAKKAWDQLGTLKLSVDEYFDEIEKCGDVIAYGNVHGYVLSDLTRRLKTEEVNRSYEIVNCIRDPISRIQSWWKRNTHVGSFVEKHRKHFKNIFDTGQLHQKLVDALQSKYDIDFDDYYNWYFVNAAVNITADVNELSLNYEHVRIEDLTTDKEYFRKFASQLVRGSFQIDDDYLAIVFNQGRMNVQAHQEISSQECFEKWDDWKKELLQLIDKDYNIISAYKKHNYNLSYIKN